MKKGTILVVAAAVLGGILLVQSGRIKSMVKGITSVTSKQQKYVGMPKDFFVDVDFTYTFTSYDMDYTWTVR